MNGPTTSSRPRVGCASSPRQPLARSQGWFHISAASSAGAAGTPAAASRERASVRAHAANVCVSAAAAAPSAGSVAVRPMPASAPSAAASRRREAGPRLEDGVEAGQRSKGAGRAVAGDRHVHQPRVQARQVIPADPEPVHDTRAEILDDDVGAADEVEEYLVARCALQVEHQRALAAVPADEAEELEAERI